MTSNSCSRLTCTSLAFSRTLVRILKRRFKVAGERIRPQYVFMQRVCTKYHDLMPTIREMFTNGPFKIFISASLLALDSNRVPRTSRVFKIGIERELVFL